MTHTVVLDVEGTLVDSNYHHALAWSRALAGVGVHASLWRVHQVLGLEPARLIAALAGDAATEHVDDLVHQHDHLFRQMLADVAAQDGARELVADLHATGFTVALTTSSPPDQLQHYTDLLVGTHSGPRFTTTPRPTTGNEHSRDQHPPAHVDKDDTFVPPQPTAFDAAVQAGSTRLHQVPVSATLDGAQRLRAVMDSLGVNDVVVVTDSTWACVAARQLGQPVIAVRTGAFIAEELLSAGAEQVFESLRGLHGDIEDTVLARPLPSRAHADTSAHTRADTRADTRAYTDPVAGLGTHGLDGYGVDRGSSGPVTGA